MLSFALQDHQRNGKSRYDI